MIIPILISLLFLAPDTLVGNVLHTGAFLYFVVRYRSSLKVDNYVGMYFFLLVFLISFTAASFNNDISAYLKDLAKNLSILFFFLFFPIHVGNYRVSRRLIITLLLLLVVSQVVLILKIQPVYDLIRDVYYSEKNLYIRSADDIFLFLRSSYRSGGFLGNPNQAAKFLNLLLVLYLIASSSTSTRFLDLIFVSLYTFSLSVTGSRTGFVVTAVILMVVMISARDTARRKGLGLTLLVFGLGLIVLSMMYGLSLRWTLLSSGFEDSFLSKIDLLFRYFGRVENPLVLLVGNFYSETAPLYYPFVFSHVRFNFDADLGYFFYAFGVLGFLCLAGKLLVLFHKQPESRVLAPLWLWLITASIFFHYKYLLFLLVATPLMGEIELMDETKTDQEMDSMSYYDGSLVTRLEHQ